jgi:hypothetical protein
MSADLLLWQEGPLDVFYAPWDWVNTAAKVMLVMGELSMTVQQQRAAGTPMIVRSGPSSPGASARPNASSARRP